MFIFPDETWLEHFSMSQMVSNASRDMKTATGRVLHLTTGCHTVGGAGFKPFDRNKRKLLHPSTLTQNALEEIEN